MGHLPPEADRAWLVDELARLIALGGEAPLVSEPIRRPTAADFPDPWNGDLTSIRALCARLLGYAGLGRLRVAVEPFAGDRRIDGIDPDGRVRLGHHGAVAWFAGIERGVVQFGCDEDALARAGEHLVGVMSHEVAHAWRSVHDLVEDDHEVEELLTDLTTIYLGFGVFTVNNAARYRTFHEDRGPRAVSGWSHEKTGYLPPEHMSYAFAAQLLARRTGCWDTWRLLRLLEPNQRGYARSALADLRPADALRRRLALDRLEAPPPLPSLRDGNRPAD